MTREGGDPSLSPGAARGGSEVSGTSGRSVRPGGRWGGERLEVFRNRSFVCFVVSRIFSGTGNGVFRAAIAYHVYDLTGSAFQLGLVGLVQFTPALGFMLLAGAVADRYNRLRIAQLAQLVPVACSTLLWLVTAGGALSLPLLYAVIVLVAVAATFENPAGGALLPLLVPRRLFPRAVTINAVFRPLAFATGPMLMGLIASRRGIASTYAVHAGFMVLSIAALALVRPRTAQAEPRAVSWQSIVEGIRFVRYQQVVLGCMTLDMFAVLFGGAVALLPIYAKDILQVDELGYGILMGSLEIGAVTTSIVLLALPTIDRAGRTLLYAVAVFGLATIVFGFSRSFPLSLAAYVAVGMADQLSVVLRGTAIQLVTPDALRGRVSSVNMLFIGASNQLGAAESGFLAALTSATFAVVSGGAACLGIVALVAAKMPALRRYRVGAAPGSAVRP